MGIERARVVEVHSPTSVTGRVGAGYLVSDRLVLTAGALVGRSGPTDIRPAGTAIWLSAALAWSAKAEHAALLEIDDPSALMVSPRGPRWGEVSGPHPVAVTAIGFPPLQARPDRARDPEQFFGQLTAGGSGSDGALLPLSSNGGRPVGDGMSGAALFAGADLVGVLLADIGSSGPGRQTAVPVHALAGDPGFARRVGDAGGLALTRVTAPPLGFPILQMP